jgi:hypothetical protein
MLHVSTHAGPLNEISRFNRLDWIDIGYEKLEAMADYKVVLFRIGEGARPAVWLKEYPRWSASLWDLVARSVALGSSEDPAAPLEHLPPHEEVAKRFAFADCMSAVIKHRAPTGTADRRLGSMEIRNVKGSRGVYEAQLEEDLRPNVLVSRFVFRPKFLYPSELIARAAVAALTGSIEAMPPRPKQYLPIAYEVDGRPHVLIHRIEEPGRTGFLRWLTRNRHPVLTVPDARDGAAPEASYFRFLKEAV